MYLALKHNLIFPHTHRHTNSSNPHLTPLLTRRCSLSECTMERDFHTLFLYLSPRNVMMRMIQMEMTTELGSPIISPSLTPRYVQVSGQHASQRWGTHFPKLLFLPPRKIRMVQRRLPTPWSFSGAVFVAAELLLQISALTLNGLGNKKSATREFPNLIRKEYRGLGKYNFSWDSGAAMTWITAVCWWHPVLVKSH